MLKSVASDASEVEQSALKMMLDPPEPLRNAAYLPDVVESAGELDLCWGKFLVTGDIGAVEKVIAVLDKEDATRPFLDEVLASGDGDADQLEGPDESSTKKLVLTAEDRNQLALVGIMIA